MTRFLSQVAAVTVIASLGLTACSTKVTRVTHDSAIDLSGKWNDTDSRLVAEEMVRDALKAGWYGKYETSKTVPTVVVGEVKNKSHEHIATDAFIKDIERALLNSGKVEFVANKAERQELRDEKADQAANATVESRQVAGEESGAQLMLTGALNSIVDKEGGKSVVYYQVDLTLIELGSNKKVWIGDKKIKKFVERSSSSL
jgi:penicillin-binding protein activator